MRQAWQLAGRGLLAALAVAVVMSAAIASLILSLPKAQSLDQLRHIFPPRNLSIPEIAACRDCLLGVAAESPVHIALLFALVYIGMQTFAIPGTISLSLLGGAMFGLRKGLALVSVVSTVGACACYCLARVAGRSLVHALWPQRLHSFAAEVKRRKQHLLNYIVFLRVTPILPNTFVNVASPIVDMPLSTFAAGTFLGCLPNNYMAVSAGSKLGELQSLRDLYDTRLLLTGTLVGVLALLAARWRVQSSNVTVA